MPKKAGLELLLKKGIITQEEVDRAKEEANRTGIPIEKAMERLGFISQSDIAMVLAESMDLPFIDLSDYLVDPEVIKLIPEPTAKKYKVVPLFKIGNTLTVAMSDPEDVVALDEIRAKSQVSTVEPVVSTIDMIQKMIDQYYGSLGSAEELVKDLAKEKIAESSRTVSGLAEIAEETPVIKLVNLIIMQAVKERASDIHIEPEDTAVIIRYRVDGILRKVQEIPKHLQSALASRVKIMAKMDIAETRNPQDGRIQLKMESRRLDLRVSSFPTVHGENLVLRILDKSAVLLNLTELGLVQADLSAFDKLIRRPSGIILVTGPTGAGKTTTLYAALSKINSVEKNIITIEDPVEYEIPLIRQTQVNNRAGLSFANGLRSILRQDPDIVMVGEIRDKETADIAIQASLTGHLVFSTLHTNDSTSSLTRLVDMGVEPFLIASSVIAILAQRLVRLICPKCKEKYAPSAEALSDLKLDPKTQFYRGKGCNHCRNSGFTGRIGIYELLIINEEIKNMVCAKQSANEIRKKAVDSGMRILYEDGLEKVNQGLSTIEEVLRVTEES